MNDHEWLVHIFRNYEAHETEALIEAIETRMGIIRAAALEEAAKIAEEAQAMVSAPQYHRDALRTAYQIAATIRARQ